MSWKFVCTSETEKECLIRRLFGHTEETAPINRGDTLFLHNNESDYLMGPFIAACESAWGMEEAAWEGRFQWQVKVTWEGPVFGLSTLSSRRMGAGDQNILSGLDLTGTLQKFSDEHTDTLLRALHEHERSRQIISPRDGEGP